MIKNNQCDRVFWVASYPRSGNTLTRLLLGHIYFNMDEGFGPLNQIMPYHSGENYKAAQKITTDFGDSIFLKTHADSCPSVDGFRNSGVYLYRHPLDVFLSSYNYCFITQESSAFKNGVCKTVDQIFADGDLGYYFDQFMDFGGIPAFQSFAGSWVENVRNWRSFAKENETDFIAVRYEDLTSDCASVFPKIAQVLGIKVTEETADEALKFINSRINHRIADEETREAAQGFFWKRETYYYQKYLTENQTNRFNEKYGDLMEELGYINKDSQ